MGGDYSWFRIYEPSGAVDLEQGSAPLRWHLIAAGYEAVPPQEDAPLDQVRRFVLFRDGPWIQLGDSASSTECQGSFSVLPPQDLGAKLSQGQQAVRMIMSDDAIVHLELWRSGERSARYGTMNFNWTLFPDDATSREFSGSPEAWVDLLATGSEPANLEELFRHAPSGQGKYAGYQGRPATEVLAGCGRLFGWNPELVEVGYSYDTDGIFIPWYEYLENSPRSRFDHSEIHFLRPPEP